MRDEGLECGTRVWNEGRGSGMWDEGRRTDEVEGGEGKGLGGSRDEVWEGRR